MEEIFRLLKHLTRLYCDNQSAIALIKDSSYHAQMKHINMQYHFIQFVVEKYSLLLVYCPTEDMVMDTLTKALPALKVKHFTVLLGLHMI